MTFYQAIYMAPISILLLYVQSYTKSHCADVEGHKNTPIHAQSLPLNDESTLKIMHLLRRLKVDA